MNNPNTGGPAFPSGLIDPSTPEDLVKPVHVGMDLRDYFGAKAMQGLLAGWANGLPKANDMAEAAYCYADAMLKARTK